MNTMKKWRLAAACAVVACSISAPCAAALVAGTYRCDGIDTDGKGYGGQLVVKQYAQAWSVTWIDDAPVPRAVGRAVLVGTSLAAGWSPDPAWITNYDTSVDGQLQGSWTNKSGKLGMESCTLT